jgi:hypothetical protein
VDFRFELENALREKRPAEVVEMRASLGIERADVTGFLDGRCSLNHREIQQLLSYLGFKLERVSDGV